MVENKIFKEIIIGILIICLFVVAIIIIKPIAIAIFCGVLLATVFYPLYTIVLKKVKNESLAASIVGIGLLILIFIIIALLLSYIIPQAISLYLGMQDLDLTNLARSLTPSFLSSNLSTLVTSSITAFISNFFSKFVASFNDFILALPVFFLQVFVVLFIFFFSLRDGAKAIDYLKSLLPLKKEVQEKFFKHFKDITHSVLIGQIIVGVVQGLICGIGFFIFGVDNAFFLTVLSVIISIIPIIGPWLVWVPVDVYLFSTGHSGAGLGLLIYGLIIVSWIDNIIRPLIVSRKTQINSAIITIGMIGGFFILGVFGLIIGPLILAYVLLVIELYRKKTIDEDENLIFKTAE